MSVRGLGAAFAYFTVLPLGRSATTATNADLFGYLPFVGFVVGALAGAAAYGVALVAPHPFSVAVAFGLSIALTGGVHVDGFLDSCDALFANVTPERRLEILKDPAHGSFAIAYFAVLCVVWIAALDVVVPARLPATLAFAAASGRCISAAQAWLFPYSRGGRPGLWLLSLSAVALVVLSFIVGPHAWIALPLVAAPVALAAMWAAKRLGGKLVGDVYGALILIAEVCVLVVCAL